MQTEIQEDSCGICYDEFNQMVNVAVTKCGHRFCFNCALKMVEKKNCCALCRTELFTEENTHLDKLFLSKTLFYKCKEKYGFENEFTTNYATKYLNLLWDSFAEYNEEYVDIAKQCFEAKTSMFGMIDEDTLRSGNMYGLMLSRKDRDNGNKDAYNIFLRISTYYLKIFGKDHHETYSIFYNLITEHLALKDLKIHPDVYDP